MNVNVPERSAIRIECGNAVTFGSFENFAKCHWIQEVIRRNLGDMNSYLDLNFVVMYELHRPSGR